MRLTYDVAADAAYIYLIDEIGPGEVAKTAICDVRLDRASVNLDFDSSQRLVGVEILGASRVLPPQVLAGLA